MAYANNLREMTMKYRAVKCPCGHRACDDWHVNPVAAIQGVGFTQAQAEAVAGLLNALEDNAAGGGIMASRLTAANVTR